MYLLYQFLPIKLGIAPEVFHSLLSWPDAVLLRVELGGLGKCCGCSNV